MLYLTKQDIQIAERVLRAAAQHHAHKLAPDMKPIVTEMQGVGPKALFADAADIAAKAINVLQQMHTDLSSPDQPATAVVQLVKRPEFFASTRFREAQDNF